MPNPYFRFKQFTVYHDRCAMKVTTDGCLFGAWVACQMNNTPPGTDASLLDIGTGSGLLSLMVAQQHQVQIDAIEIDTSAARQAEENVSASSWASQITVHETDLLDFSPPQPYDIIISNPPFYEKELRSSESQRNIAHHSTQLSLRQLLQFIGLHLKEEGTFFLLLPYKREHEADQLLQQEQLFLYEKWKVRQSLNHDFFRLLLKGGKQPQSETDHELSIRDAQQQYTADFINLVKDYYLYL